MFSLHGRIGCVVTLLCATCYGQLGGAPPAEGGAKPPLYIDEVVNGELTGEKIPWGSLPRELQELLTASGPGSCTDPWEVATLWESGPSENRMDIVFLGDGFTEELQAEYNGKVAAGWQALNDVQLISDYASHLNAYRVNLISNDPCIDDPSQHPDLLCDTVLNMGYHQGGNTIEYAEQLVRNAAACAPGADKIIAYGRGNHLGGNANGDICAVSALYVRFDDVTVHETGHTIGDLADEYVTAGTYEGPEPSEANASLYDWEEQLAMQTKWYRWISGPEVCSDLDGPCIDVSNTCSFEGSLTYRFGLYRPNCRSKMGSNLDFDFGVVHLEAMLLGIYAFVSPIDGASPATGALLPPETVFTVDLLQPAGNTVSARWSVDGAFAGRGSTFRFLDYVQNNIFIPPGTYEVKVTVTDNTPYVRDEEARAELMTDERVWYVAVGDGFCLDRDDCEQGSWCQKPDGACQSPGVCARPPFGCSNTDDVVCGCDGYDYTNRCWAHLFGVNVAQDGRCPADGVCCGIDCTLLTTRSDCESMCGVWLGGDAACDDCPDEPSVTTCCYQVDTAYVCDQLTEELCACVGGVSYGPDLRCEEISCP